MCLHCKLDIIFCRQFIFKEITLCNPVLGLPHGFYHCLCKIICCCLVAKSGEGNGNPLQCSCLENPRDQGARSAAIYGVAQSRTRLKRLSSSSSMHISSLDYLQYIIQCKCHVNTCKYNVNAMKIVAGLQQIQVLLFGTF